jgi:hypothetical protein
MCTTGWNWLIPANHNKVRPFLSGTAKSETSEVCRSSSLAVFPVRAGPGSRERSVSGNRRRAWCCLRLSRFAGPAPDPQARDLPQNVARCNQ